MAIVERIYVVKGPRTQLLKDLVSPTVAVLDRFPARMLQVSIDDSVDGVLDALDSVMEQEGYALEAAEPVLEVFERATHPGTIPGIARLYGFLTEGGTQLLLRSGNGTITHLTPSQSPSGYISGCVASYVSATTIQISAGRVRSKNDSMDLILAAAANIDITVAGIGGLDTGVEDANSWYYAFVIGDSTGVNPVGVIMSTSTGAPLLPAGYDVSRRVGSVRNQAGNFRDFVVFGDGSSREVQYRDAITSRQVLAAGAAVIVTEVSLVNYIPGPSRVAMVQYQQLGIVGGLLFFDPALPIGTPQRTLGAGLQSTDTLCTSATRRIAYANVAIGGLLDIWVTGYKESL